MIIFFLIALCYATPICDDIPKVRCFTEGQDFIGWDNCNIAIEPTTLTIGNSSASSIVLQEIDKTEYYWWYTKGALTAEVIGQSASYVSYDGTNKFTFSQAGFYHIMISSRPATTQNTYTISAPGLFDGVTTIYDSYNVYKGPTNMISGITEYFAASQTFTLSSFSAATSDYPAIIYIIKLANI